MSKHRYENPETVTVGDYEVTTKTCACGSFTADYKRGETSTTYNHEGNVNCYLGSTPPTPIKDLGTIYPGLNEYEK